MIANGRDPGVEPRTILGRGLGGERETHPALPLRACESSELLVQRHSVAVSEITQRIPGRH